MLRLAAGLVGCAQMAALVALGGFAPLHWALFGLISVASVWLSRREAELRHLPSAGLAIALLLTGAWSAPDHLLLGLVLAGIALIYGGAALARLWRADGTLAEAITLAAIALSALLVPMLHFYRLDGQYDGEFALLGLLGAAIAGASAALGWRSDARKNDWRFALLIATASALVVAAAILALPGWAIAPASALIASALLWFAARADDPRIATAAWGVAAVTIGLLLTGFDVTQERRAFGLPAPADAAQAFRWLVPAAMAALFAQLGSWKDRQSVAEPFAILCAYVALAQLVPPLLLPLVPALFLVAAALAVRPTPLPALIASWFLILLWATGPATQWLAEALESLLGAPFLSSEVPGPSDVALRLILPAAAIVLALRSADLPARLRKVAMVSSILFAAIAAHSLFKQFLAIDSEPRFVALGYAERTLWEAQLAALALLAWQWRRRTATIALAAAALAHFAWYSLVIHNPLWSQQSAGLWIVPAFALAFAILWATNRAALLPALDRARDWARMLLIPLFGLSLLRLAFAGPILSSAPIGQSEDILRSLLGTLVAIGFLQYGIRAASRDWRIASLALMLATVAKVFLRDASGLDGLVRVASFAALGFSLIGIGWLYSRYLPDPDRKNDPRPVAN